VSLRFFATEFHNVCYCYVKVHGKVIYLKSMYYISDYSCNCSVVYAVSDIELALATLFDIYETMDIRNSY